MSKMPVKESSISNIARSIKEGLREVLTYNMGRVGLAILVFMVVMSIYSIIVLPGDFPAMWRYVTEPPWIYNPRSALPSWVEYLGFDVSETRTYTAIRPQESRVIINPDDLFRYAPEVERALGARRVALIGYLEVYRVEYNLDSRSYPQDIIVLFNVKASENVNLTNIRVIALLYVTRPDDVILKIGELSVSLNMLNYMKATHEYFSLPYISYYNLNLTLEEMKTYFNIAIFGKPITSREFESLRGTYQITLVLLYIGIDPREISRLIADRSLSVSVDIKVLGTSYGLLGTDIYGRDLFMGLLFGFPVALTIGFLVSLAIVAIGLTLGVISGYFGGRIDEIIQRAIDIIANIPLLPILILVGVAIQTQGWTGWPALSIIMIILVAFSWGGVAIISRSMALSIKSEPYIEAAKALGASTTRIIFRHIIPQIIPYAMAALVFGVPSAIIAEAGLSVLGIDHGLPTWGRLLADAQANRGVAYNMWWWVLPPGLLLGLFSFAFVALGFTLETIVEPRLRRR
ncbi:MAG: ABC transporter permease [Acidilobaceae archaeon]